MKLRRSSYIVEDIAIKLLTNVMSSELEACAANNFLVLDLQWKGTSFLDMKKRKTRLGSTSFVALFEIKVTLLAYQIYQSCGRRKGYIRENHVT